MTTFFIRIYDPIRYDAVACNCTLCVGHSCSEAVETEDKLQIDDAVASAADDAR